MTTSPLTQEIEGFDDRLAMRGGAGFFWLNGNLNPDAIKHYFESALSRMYERGVKDAMEAVAEKSENEESYDTGSEHATPRNYRADGWNACRAATLEMIKDLLK